MMVEGGGGSEILHSKVGWCWWNGGMVERTFRFQDLASCKGS